MFFFYLKLTLSVKIKRTPQNIPGGSVRFLF